MPKLRTTLKKVKGKPNAYYLEHMEEKDFYLTNVHPKDKCKGEVCVIHHLTNHRMRNFPQWWRSDRGIMERTCTHGVGHPDPDDYRVINFSYEGVHGCDGCCAPHGFLGA